MSIVTRRSDQEQPYRPKDRLTGAYEALEAACVADRDVEVIDRLLVAVGYLADGDFTTLRLVRAVRESRR